MEQLDHSTGNSGQDLVRIRIRAAGIVQGVGFRPYIYRLALRNGITGSVRNLSGEVNIEAEGPLSHIHLFVDQIRSEASPPIRIDSLTWTFIPVANDSEFVITPSIDEGSTGTGSPPDLAVCSLCMEEVHSSITRFYQYPFISCTCCGPRFSAIHSLPYDRHSTSFKSFRLCQSCEADYQDQSNRRFHAQTLACQACGPSLEMLDSSGKKRSQENPLTDCQSAIREGRIVAVKGTGGIHLICNAEQKPAIEKLRSRKCRPNKPLALMAKNMNAVMACFEVSPQEIEVLESPAAPIVLLKPKPAASMVLPLEAIAPGLFRIGVFMPYTPLHQLLFPDEWDWLVVTSGNAYGAPTIYTNQDAVNRLLGIADLYLFHNRDIVMWNDDSVGQMTKDGFQLMRRSRGYVPEGMSIPLPCQSSVKWPVTLGVGAEDKNTFCFIDQGKAILSQHIGNTSTLEGIGAHHAARDHFMQLYGWKPQIIAFDPHPDYLISKEVRESSEGQTIPVYHHHAHMAACMAEHGIDTPVIGCILDGTGYGPEGRLLGFEILTGDYCDFKSIHHLKPVRLPGGEVAIRNPWMTGMAYLYEAACGDRASFMALAMERFPQYETKYPVVMAQLEGRLPSPEVSSAGRLFDGISAILTICTESTYEGEGAIRLSEIIEMAHNQEVSLENKYTYEIVNDYWDTATMIRQILFDLKKNMDPSVIVYKFHHTVAHMILDGVRKAHRISGITDVVFSGGVWNNRYLQRISRLLLANDGFNVYTHQAVPAGDGGIALGQAVCGLWRWAKGHVLIGSGKSR